MAGAVQGYLPPTLSETLPTLPTPGFFTAALGDSEDQNVFEAAFKSSHVDKEQDSTQTQAHPSSFLRLSGNEAVPSPNALDSQTSLPTDFLTSMLWDTSSDKANAQSQKGQAPVNTRGLTPPLSLDNSSDQWSFDGPSQSTSLNLKSLPLEPQARPTSASRFGQVTPPEEASPVIGPPRPMFHGEAGETNADISGPKSPQAPEPSIERFATATAAPKRKRTKQVASTGGAGEETSSSSPKRRRKQSNAIPKSESAEEKKSLMAAVKGHGEDDVKRSRFLERNRLAASKCRQKKKEWTSNLESRARELQNEKNQLALMCGSLREEVLYLKGELLKHSSCGCASIRDYLNREVSNLSRSSKDSRYSPFGPPPPPPPQQQQQQSAPRASSLDLGRTDNTSANPSAAFEDMVARRITLPVVGYPSNGLSQDLASSASPSMSAATSAAAFDMSDADADGASPVSHFGSVSMQSPSDTIPVLDEVSMQ